MAAEIETYIRDNRTQLGISKFYRCEKCGEMYGIGECGKPDIIGNCAFCKNEIGGTGHNLKNHLDELQKKMFSAAENLEFEEAAKLRDEINRLQASELEIRADPFIKRNKN